MRTKLPSKQIAFLKYGMADASTVASGRASWMQGSWVIKPHTIGKDVSGMFYMFQVQMFGRILVYLRKNRISN